MTVYRNARVLSVDPPRVGEGVDLVVQDGVFSAIVPRGAAPVEGESRDLRGAYVMPGLVCAHNHVYSALARGMTAAVAPSSSFVQHLQNLWWRLDRALEERALRSSALVAALEAVACGTTTVVDHHASPSFIAGSLATIREAFVRVGLRGVLCYETTDRNGRVGAEEGIAENRAFAAEVDRERARGGAKPLVEACIGAHAPFTLSDRTLEGLASAVTDTGRGLHLHVAEDLYDVSFAHHHWGRDVLSLLDSHRLLGPRSIVVHGVHLGAPDLELLRERDAHLVHNPRSNMNNAVGYARHAASLANVALGTDGIGSDMLAECAACFFKARDAGLELASTDAARMLCRGNELIARIFGGRFGCIGPGCAADFAVLDYDPPTPITEGNVAAHLVFGISSRHVRSVVIAGRPVYTDRQFPFDTSEIYARAREDARALWERVDGL